MRAAVESYLVWLLSQSLPVLPVHSTTGRIQWGYRKASLEARLWPARRQSWKHECCNRNEEKLWKVSLRRKNWNLYWNVLLHTVAWIYCCMHIMLHERTVARSWHERNVAWTYCCMNILLHEYTVVWTYCYLNILLHEHHTSNEWPSRPFILVMPRVSCCLHEFKDYSNLLNWSVQF